MLQVVRDGVGCVQQRGSVQQQAVALAAWNHARIDVVVAGLADGDGLGVDLGGLADRDGAARQHRGLARGDHFVFADIGRRDRAVGPGLRLVGFLRVSVDLPKLSDAPAGADLGNIELGGFALRDQAAVAELPNRQQQFIQPVGRKAPHRWAGLGALRSGQQAQRLVVQFRVQLADLGDVGRGRLTRGLRLGFRDGAFHRRDGAVQAFGAQDAVRGVGRGRQGLVFGLGQFARFARSQCAAQHAADSANTGRVDDVLQALLVGQRLSCAVVLKHRLNGLGARLARHARRNLARRTAQQPRARQFNAVGVQPWHPGLAALEHAARHDGFARGVDARSKTRGCQDAELVAAVQRSALLLGFLDGIGVNAAEFHALVVQERPRASAPGHRLFAEGFGCDITRRTLRHFSSRATLQGILGCRVS